LSVEWKILREDSGDRLSRWLPRRIRLDREQLVVTNDIGFIDTGKDKRGFDIVYEEASGDAVLVYGVKSSDTAQDLAYRVWDGTSWTAEQYIDDTDESSDVHAWWVSLVADPVGGSDEIALLYVDEKQSDVVSMIWDGSSWGNYYELTDAISDKNREAIAIAYEQNSGALQGPREVLQSNVCIARQPVARAHTKLTCSSSLYRHSINHILNI